MDSCFMADFIIFQKCFCPLCEKILHPWPTNVRAEHLTCDVPPPGRIIYLHPCWPPEQPHDLLWPMKSSHKDFVKRMQ